MPTPEPGGALLGFLRENWRALAGGLAATAVQSAPSEECLEVQVSEFQAGRAASFPYFKAGAGDVTWLTVARTADDLRREIEDLRAWLMPSYAVEVRFASPSGTPTGELGRLALEVSPSGYWVWKCPHLLAGTVAERLRLRIRVNASRPAKVAMETPSLYELRLQFRAALVAGDRDQAAEAIEAIDANALDGASNVAFMRIRMWDQFGEHDFVDDEELVRKVTRLRAPSAVRMALVRAVHAHHLQELEEGGQIKAAEEVFQRVVEPLLSAVLDGCRPSDGPQVARCLAYRARRTRPAAEVIDALKDLDDPVVTSVLTAVERRGEPKQATGASLAEAEVASIRGDLRAAQEAGVAALRAQLADLPEELRSRWRALMEETLAHRSNPELAEALGRLGDAQTARTIPPQTWSEFHAACEHGKWQDAQSFLDSENRPRSVDLGPVGLLAELEKFEELLTDPSVANEGLARNVLCSAVLNVIEDCKEDARFPRVDFAQSYRAALDLWTLVRAGSTQHEDASLFYMLADAVLQLEPGESSRVLAALTGWWGRRPSAALLPFLQGGLSLASHYGLQREELANLYVLAANFVLTQRVELTRGDRRSWRSIGSRLGLTEADLDRYFGTENANEADPLATANLTKVAIVSTREKQAREAAEQIRRRTGANVVVVTETDAGAMARNARTADVILVVWLAISHAVFRAFDGVRDKVVYVQGTGAENIVLALEGRVTRQSAYPIGAIESTPSVEASQ